MKKLLSVLLVLGAITATAEDSYLYWMVGANPTPSDYSFAGVVAISTENGSQRYLSILNAEGDPISPTSAGAYGSGLITTTQMDANMASSFGLYATLISDPNLYTYVIEIRNDQGVSFFSDEISYSTALANNYVTTDNSMVLPSMWAPTSFAVPEPNSGLLMLIGCAMLGLRRRRQRKV